MEEIEMKIPKHDKYITNDEFGKLTKQNSNKRFKQEKLASKNDIDDFIKRSGFNEKLRKR